LKLVPLDSEPSPDVLAISSPHIEAYETQGTKPLLVVEVAEASLRYDLNVKAELYAEAGVPEYWVVNLVDREIVVFRSPYDHGYRHRSTHRAGGRVALEAWPDVVIGVEELFPTAEG
jgi:Uma2 family endonuclease